MTDFPGLNREATEYIIDQGAVNFGVDSPSPDMWYDKTYPCHSVCGERGVTHIENLCNLDKLVGKRFHLYRPAPENTRGNRFPHAGGGHPDGRLI